MLRVLCWWLEGEVTLLKVSSNFIKSGSFQTFGVRSK